MRIESLEASVVDPELAARVCVPAFDAASPEGRRAIRLREPLSWLHAMQPAEAHGSAESAARASAAEADRLLAEGVFVEHPPSLFVYRLTEGAWTQTGVVADLPVEHFTDGTVLPHEGTRSEQVQQLVRYFEVVGLASSPLAVAYRSTEQIARLVDLVTGQEPILSFVATDGLRQEVWAVPSRLAAPLRTAFGDVERAYITDGHHRSSAAVAYAAGDGPSRFGGPRSARVLTVLFPDDHLRIVEFNRIIHEVSDPAPLQRRLAAWGASPVRREQAKPTRPGQLGVWVSGFWYSVDLPIDPGLRLPDSLDPAVLQDQVLGPVFGISDPTADSRIEYVPGSVPLGDIEHRARSGAAFVLSPVSIADMMAVSDAGGRMPPKSTYFEPKVRSGVFLVRR